MRDRLERVPRQLSGLPCPSARKDPSPPDAPRRPYAGPGRYRQDLEYRCNLWCDYCYMYETPDETAHLVWVTPYSEIRRVPQGGERYRFGVVGSSLTAHAAGGPPALIDHGQPVNVGRSLDVQAQRSVLCGPELSYSMVCVGILKETVCVFRTPTPRPTGARVAGNLGAGGKRDLDARTHRNRVCRALCGPVKTSIIWLDWLRPGSRRSLCVIADDQNVGTVIWQKFLDNSVICHAVGAAMCETPLLPVQWVSHTTGTTWPSSRISTTKTGSSLTIRTVSSPAASRLTCRKRLVAVSSSSARVGATSRAQDLLRRPPRLMNR